MSGAGAAGAGIHAAVADASGLRMRGEAGALFPWWSFSKTVIAICVLRLAEEGRVTLDQPLPGREFTPRQLLRHQAGVADYGGLPAYHEAVARDEAPWPRERLMKEAGADRLLFPPGRGWAYSNIGYLFLRDLVEETTGDDLGDAVSRMATGPLGLSSVRLAREREDMAQVRWPEGRRYHPGWVCHGCLLGTAIDAARLLQGLFAGELLRPGTLGEMTKVVPLGGAVPGRPWTEAGYALGLMSGRMGEAGAAVGHSGGGPFSVNAVYRFPDLPGAPVVAAFAAGQDEGGPEAACARLALGA